MEPLRWNEAKPKDHRTKHENQACLVADKGLDVANYTRASGGGRKMFLTSPLIDQAITQNSLVRLRGAILARMDKVVHRVSGAARQVGAHN
jgi:hypothetical protein